MHVSLDDLKRAVLEGDDVAVEELVRKALNEGATASEIVQKAVMRGIQEAGELWQRNQYFMPDMVMSAEAFRKAMGILEPLIAGKQKSPVGTFLIGTVAGDMHDLGKMIVVAMLRGAGFRVIDLGEDVPRETFLTKVQELKPDILGLGCYMTTTMAEVATIVGEIKRSAFKDKLAVMVGGVPTSQKFADEIGADGWGQDAIDAVKKSMALVKAR